MEKAGRPHPPHRPAGLRHRYAHGVAHPAARGAQHRARPFAAQPVLGDDFVYLDNLTENARFTDALLTEWLARYSDEEAAAIVDALFKAVEASGAQNATEVFFGGAKTVALLSEAAKNIDGTARETLVGALGSLAELAGHRVTQGIVERIVPKKKARS